MKKGFTLSELLIALAILGVIATFTIPKVLQTQQNGAYKSAAKEAAGTISAAYQAYKFQNTVTSSFKASDLTPYMNYVKMETTGAVDDAHTYGQRPCLASQPCLRLHNGAVLNFDAATLAGTATTNAVWFLVDPDGIDSGTTNGPGKGVYFALYYGGRLATLGTILPGTVNSYTTFNPDPAADPPWFNWN